MAAGEVIRTTGASPDIPVVYLDNHLLVVEKPAGLLVQEDVTGDLDLLTLGRAWLKKRFEKPGNVFLALVQRLDRPVSGLIVLARTSKAAARLGSQIAERSVVKRYCAVVEGRMLGSGVLEHWVRKQGKQPRIVRKELPGATRAVLAWRSVAEIGGRTLVDVDLKTGRPHQIRLQLAEQGHPVVGDLKHGAPEPWIGRSIALHCYALSVAHPTRAETMVWTSIPSTWGADWQRHIADLVREARQEAETNSIPSSASGTHGNTTT